jgi:hypothetical protein
VPVFVRSAIRARGLSASTQAKSTRTETPKWCSSSEVGKPVAIGSNDVLLGLKSGSGGTFKPEGWLSPSSAVQVRSGREARSCSRTSRRNAEGCLGVAAADAAAPLTRGSDTRAGGTGGGGIAAGAPVLLVEVDAFGEVFQSPDSGRVRTYAAASSACPSTGVTVAPAKATAGAPTARGTLAASANTTK